MFQILTLLGLFENFWRNLVGLKFAVIGSNCFTGTHVVDWLLEDPLNFVVGLSRSPEKSSLYLPYKKKNLNNFRFVQLDLNHDTQRLLQILDELKPEFVINVAALSEVYQSHLTPNEYFQVNTTAVVRLANELRSRKWLKRYIHTSSAEVYGACSGALHEQAPLNPSTPYAVSKAAADMYLLTLAKNFDFPVTIVRSTNVYGKHQQLFKIIPRTIIYLKQGKTIELHGGGSSIKCFIHIRDVVEGIKKIVEHPSPSFIYHFSTDNDYNVKKVVSLLCEKMGCPFEKHVKEVGERLGQDPRYWLNYDKAKKELGWYPQVSFEKGIDETIQWIEQNWDEIQKESLLYIHKI